MSFTKAPSVIRVTMRRVNYGETDRFSAVARRKFGAQAQSRPNGGEGPRLIPELNFSDGHYCDLESGNA